MIIGEVRPTREALISISVRGPAKAVDLVAVVDTGFTDYLALPHNVVIQLKLPYLESAAYGLADGTEAMLDVHEGSVLWDGRWRHTFASAADGDALVGMGLMEGHHLGIDVIDGGRVEIRPLKE